MAVLAVVLALAHGGFAFGRNGGNIIPFTVTVAASGRVTTTGAAPAHRTTVTKAQLAAVERVVIAAHYSKLPAVTACPGTLPDVAAQWIRADGRTVRVHGGCLAGFNRVWDALNRAVRP